MPETVLLGQGRQMTELPRETWEEHLSQVPQHSETRLGFMSEEHHLVRQFVVRELPSAGNPMQPEFISQSLKLPVIRVNTILDELGRNLFGVLERENEPKSIDNLPSVHAIGIRCDSLACSLL